MMRHIRQRAVMCTVAAALAALGLAVSAPAVLAQAKEVKVGLIAPLSGPWARQGDLMRQQQRVSAHAPDRLDLDFRLFSAQRHDEPIRGAAAERNRDTMARHQVHAVGDRICVGLAIQGAGRLDRYLRVEQILMASA